MITDIDHMKIFLWSKAGDDLEIIAKLAGCGIVYGTHEECVSKIARRLFDIYGCLDEAIRQIDELT